MTTVGQKDIGAHLNSAYWEMHGDRAATSLSLTGEPKEDPVTVTRTIGGAVVSISDTDEKHEMFAEGGLVRSTGLKWLDGTMARPERVLSPWQTELFEILVKSMEQMSRLHVNVPYINPQFSSAALAGNTFGDIIVNVEQLIDSEDYDEVADQVMDHINQRLARGMSVGGIRMT